MPTIKRILVVHPDQAMLDTIGDLLSDLGNAMPDFSLVNWRTRTAASALRRIDRLQQADALDGTHRDPIDLLITALDVAADDASPTAAGEQGRRGLELVGTLRARAPQLAAVIVSGEAIDTQREGNPPKGTQWVCEGRAFDDELTAAVSRFLQSRHDDAPEHVELWISLSSSPERCGYQIQTGHGRPSLWRPIDIDAHKLARFISLSQMVNVQAATWERALEILGETFAEALLSGPPNNIALRDDLNFWKGKAGVGNIRVRFSVEDDLHAIAVEAMKQPDDNQWMMEHTAIYRGLEAYWDHTALEPRGLFQDEHRLVNVLIIRADIPITSTVMTGGLQIELQPLPCAADEVATIISVLDRARVAGDGIGDVRVISTDLLPGDHSFGEVVEDVLREGTWHVVHYVGHTHYNAADRAEAGYLFFPNAGPIRLEPVGSGHFARMLKDAGTRFVFLSSCQSAGQDFIYHLAHQHIPAIMGFLWKVRDERAVDFARSFYRHLFCDTPRTLENACFEAKRDMHAQFPTDPIWASPALFMQ